MKKNQNGITLVALVITIIVLLILAGVTLAALSGQNGILRRGAQSKVATNVANAKDLINVAVQEAITEYYKERYVDGSTTVDNDIGAYACTKLNPTTGTVTQAKSVIASVADKTITSNVKDANGNILTATLDTSGSITWTNDALEPTGTGD